MTEEKKNKGGRPLLFKTPEELQERIDQYFDDCDEGPLRPYTVTGLAVALDTDRSTLLRYEKEDEYYDTIKKAKAIIHNYAEESLWKSGIVAGVIFNLKNNWGWRDQSETDITSGGEKIEGVQIYKPSKK